MKKIKRILNKCKSLSKQLGRSSSSTSSTSKSAREEEQQETVFVGSNKRLYTISSKHLNHPLMNALIEEKSKQSPSRDITVKCEVVLFDHLLWMLDNVDPILTSEPLEELAELYAL
ncbi:hypothetical protein L1049_009941 [Liquidambar formosana]|uniref:Small auxin up regulated protein n=1 Tax=Liquidambar formosana TaxID=63359 RepID=A0AAP0N6M9_LIQFO